MSLQTKLFLFFTITVILPLGAAGLLGERAVTHALKSQDRDRVSLSTPGVLSLYAQRLAGMPNAASAIDADPDVARYLMSGDTTGLDAALRAGLDKQAGSLDFAVVGDAQSQVAGAVVGLPNYLPGTPRPRASQLLATQTAQPSGSSSGADPTGTASGSPAVPASLLVAKAILTIYGGSPPSPVGTLVAGSYLDNALARSLAAATGDGVTIVAGSRVVATSLSTEGWSTFAWTVPASASPGVPVATTFDGRRFNVVVSPLMQGVPLTSAALVTSTPQVAGSAIREIDVSIIAVLILAAIGTAGLGLTASRAIARPLRELADGADAVAAGRYDARIAVRSADEVGQLAHAFNQMAQRLSVHVAELQGSREELKRSLTRFGETLRSTHDANKILEVVLDTSVDALRARAGFIVVAQPPGEAPAPARLTVAAAKGIDTQGLWLAVGEGVAGSVAATGQPVTVPPQPPTAELPVASPKEPAARTGIWVPVFARGRLCAVLSVLDRDDGGDFTPEDLATVQALAGQAGVAIENVALHEEAQRLAITDSMTGIWNHRYFQLRFGQEMDRAGRFRRPFCVLLCDIDHFKEVNDTHGHQVGDEVLIELARRIRSEVRDIDVLARYGGEEFVLMLPETDTEGGLRTAEKIRRRVADAPFGPDRRLKVTISVGVAGFPRAGTETTALLRAADVALYQAKSQGRNRTVVFRPAEGEAG